MPLAVLGRNARGLPLVGRKELQKDVLTARHETNRRKTAPGPFIVGADVHLACFDMSDDVTAMLRSGDASFTIDQQQRLQGYMPIIVLHLYNTNAGMLPGANIPSGPGFVDASNIDNVASQAGINR